MFTTGTIANCWFWRRPQSQIDAEVKLGCLCCHYNLEHHFSQRGLPQPPSPSVTTVLNRFFPAWLSQKIGIYFKKNIYEHLRGGWAASLHIRFIKKDFIALWTSTPRASNNVIKDSSSDSKLTSIAPGQTGTWLHYPFLFISILSFTIITIYYHQLFMKVLFLNLWKYELWRNRVLSLPSLGAACSQRRENAAKLQKSCTVARKRCKSCNKVAKELGRTVFCLFCILHCSLFPPCPHQPSRSLQSRSNIASQQWNLLGKW